MGSTTQLTSDFKGDNLSVRMWGCKVDGVTDDTVNFQAAINQCASLGSALMIPGDNILLCSSVKLPSNLILIGRPGAMVRQLDGAAIASTPFVTNSAHSGSGNSNLTLQGITFDGNSTNQTAANVDILSLLNHKNVVIKDCNFTNAVRGQVFGQKITGISIEDCTFSNWAAGNVGAIYLAARTGNNFGGPGGAISQISISGCTVDGRSSHSSCIKLDADSSHFITGVIVSSNTCYPGDGTLTSAPDKSTLGIELYNGTPGTSSTFNFTVSGNVLEGENSTGTEIFGISLGGAGCVNGTCTGNSIFQCNAFGIEIIGQQIAVTGNSLNASGVISVDSGASSCSQIVIANNVVVNPPYFSGTLIAIHVIGHTTAGPGPYTISDVIITGNSISSTSAQPTNLIVVESQVAGYNIWDIQISGNHLIGPSTADGLGIGPNTGTCQYVTVRDNYFYGLGVAINQGGTYSRYLFNRFVNITTQYNTTFPPDALVIDIDESLSTPILDVQSLLVRGQSLPILLSSGDVGLPFETTAFTSQSALNQPNVLCWNGVNFGSVLQGAYLSSNSRWLGGGNWGQTSSNSYTRAMWVGFGAGRFRVDFGPATNSNGAEPGALTAFSVIDPSYGGGVPGGVYTGPSCPIFVQNNAAIFSFSGDPNGSSSGGLSTTTPLGSLGLDITGNLWEKTSGYGTLLGWEKLQPSYWTADANGIETADNVGIGTASSAGTGTLTVFDVIKNNALTATRPVVTNGSKQLISSLIDLSSANFVQGSSLGAGNILTWDGSKVLGIPAGVNTTITGISSGPTGTTVLTSASGTFVDSITFNAGGSGATLSFTISSVSTTGTTVVESFGVTTHTVTGGIVTS